MSDNIPTTGQLFEYQHSNVILAAVGTCLDGGRVAVSDDLLSINLEFDVPSVEFTMLALLMDRALVSETLTDGQRIGFVAKSQLFLHLKRLFLIDDPRTVTRSIYRLRERFRKEVRRKLGEAAAHEWSRSLIETSMLGYRISIPPQNLRLDLLDSDLSATGSYARPPVSPGFRRDRSGIGRVSHIAQRCVAILLSHQEQEFEP